MRQTLVHVIKYPLTQHLTPVFKPIGPAATVAPTKQTFTTACDKGVAIFDVAKGRFLEVQKQPMMYFAPTRSFFVLAFYLNTTIEDFFPQLYGR